MAARKVAAKRAAAKPAAVPARPPAPVVKAVAHPVTPTIKAGAQRVTPTPKVGPAPAVAGPRGRPATKPPARATGAAKPAKAAPKETPKAAQQAARKATPKSPSKATSKTSSKATRGGPGTRDARPLRTPLRDAETFRPPPVGNISPDGPAAEAPARPWPEAADRHRGETPARPVFEAAPPGSAQPRLSPPPPDLPAEPVRPVGPSWRRARPVATMARDDVIGEALARHPDDPVDFGPEPVVLPAPVDIRYDTRADEDRSGQPILLRVVRADWRPTLAATLPALVATFVLVGIVSLSLTLVTTGDGEPLLGDTPAGRWFRIACAAVGLTYGGKLSVRRTAEEQDFTIAFAVQWAPLTLTAASLVALWFLARRAHQRNVLPDRLPDAIRAGLAFALGIGLVAWLGRWQVTTEAADGLLNPFRSPTTRTAFTTSVAQPMFWAFCGGTAVVWLATGNVVVTGRWATRLLAVRGALAGLAAGGAASLVLTLVAGWVSADRAGAGSTDVTNALPVAAAYAPGLGAAAFAVTSGGWFVWPFAERAYWSLWAPWLPNWYLLALVVPVFAVAAAVVHLQRQRDVPFGELSRACRWMGVPAGLGWLVLGTLGAARWEQAGSWAFLGRTAAGGVAWNALVVGLWFAVGGRAAAWYLARQAGLAEIPASGDADGEDRPGSLPG